MLRDPFLQFLDRATTAERKLVFQNAYLILAHAGLRDHVFWIDQMMESDEETDTSSFLFTIETLLNGAIHDTVLQFGVRLDDACPLAMSTEILQGILAMDNWDDAEALSNAAEIDESSEVALAAMLAIVGAHHEADYLPHLTSVSLNLINRIDAVNQTTYAGVLPTTEEHARAHERLTMFFATYSAPILSHAISEMLLIGGDYKGLVSNYESSISTLAMVEAVNELVGFALASDLPNGAALQQAVLNESQGWWDGDVTNATKLAALISERLKKANAL